MNHGNGIEASASDGFCGTSYAAKLLGVSVGTVQGLVEKNELQAWKTQGGHRRISLTSIYDYQRRYNLHATPFGPEQQRLRVLVVDDDPPTREMLQSHFQQWKGPIDVSFYASPLDADNFHVLDYRNSPALTVNHPTLGPITTGRETDTPTRRFLISPAQPLLYSMNHLLRILVALSAGLISAVTRSTAQTLPARPPAGVALRSPPTRAARAPPPLPVLAGASTPRATPREKPDPVAEWVFHSERPYSR